MGKQLQSPEKRDTPTLYSGDTGKDGREPDCCVSEAGHPSRFGGILGLQRAMRPSSAINASMLTCKKGE